MEEPRPRERASDFNDNMAPALAPQLCDHLCTALRTVLAEELNQHPVPNEHVDLLLALRHKERDRTRRRFA